MSGLEEFLTPEITGLAVAALVVVLGLDALARRRA